MRWLRLSGLVLTLGLTGCSTFGTMFDESQVQKIRRGMTRDEVIAIMGSPPSQEEGSNDWRLTWVWGEADVISFGARMKRVSVTFDDQGHADNVPAGGLVPEITY